MPGSGGARRASQRGAPRGGQEGEERGYLYEPVYGFGVETSYYDLETEQSVWRIVTQTRDVEHTDAARDIAGKIAAQMSAAGLK